MDLDLRLRQLAKTCVAVPSQWEGKTEDGREVYVRYRYGRLSVEVGGPDIEWLRRDRYPDTSLQPGDRTVFVLDHGGELDGYMETGEMLELTGICYDGDAEQVDEEAFEDLREGRWGSR